MSDPPIQQASSKFCKVAFFRGRKPLDNDGFDLR